MQDGGKVETSTAADDDPDRRSPEETARIRDEALRRALAMPPKPQEEMKLGKRRRGAARALPERAGISPGGGAWQKSDA